MVLLRCKQTAVTGLLEFRQEVIDNDDGLFIPIDLPKVNLRLTEFVAVLDTWRAPLQRSPLVR